MPHPEPPDDPHVGGNTPAHNAPAERAVLGALILAPHLAPKVALELDRGDFYQPRHTTVWDAIQSLTGQLAGDVRLDSVLLADHLTRTGDLQRIGGAPYLHELVEACPLPSNALEYATRVRDAARLRRVAETATRLAAIANSGDLDDLEQTFTRAYETLDAAAARIGPTNPDQTPSTWAPVDLAPVLAGEHLDPPPTMLRRTDGQPLLYDGAVHTISGESESGKTWLTLIAALQLVQDGENVVFLDFEDRADRVVGRLLALGATLPQIAQHFAYIRPDRPLDNDGRAALAPCLRDVRLVIVDGVTEAMTMHGYDLNSNADSALFQGLLPRWIADHGPAVVLIDHVVKDKEKQDRFALGAQHKLAGIDGVAYIVKMLQPFARGHRGLARVEIAKDRPGHVREYAHGRSIAEFTLDATASDVVLTAHLMPPGEQSGRAGDTFEPTILMERISRFVQTTPGLSKQSIEGAMNGKATTIRLALELLVTRGYIGVKTGAKNRIEHYHQKAYYADPDVDEEAANREES